jgi:diadenosine tetraphosphate (Ap4A) HIT family hydrolase
MSCPEDIEVADSAFELHPWFDAETIFVKDWPLSRIMLKDDARFPWLILVPRKPGLVELHDLADNDAVDFFKEIRQVSGKIARVFSSDKINFGAVGNRIPQLHVHVVGRSASDPLWPGVVWGNPDAVRYTPISLEERLQLLCLEL